MVVVLSDSKNQNILRYAVGSTITIALAMAFNWPLSYILPVLSLSFFASGNPAPDLKGGFMFFIVIAFSSIVGLLLAKLFLPFPLIHILILVLILFHIFHTNHPLFNPFLKIFLLITIMLIPNIALSSKETAVVLAIGLSANAGIAMLVIWLVFLIFPSPKVIKPTLAISSIKHEPTKRERFNTAATSTLVILPVLLLYYFYDLASSLLVLIFIAILSMQPDFAKDFKGGKAMIIGNLTGGLVAIIVYEIFTVIPELFYLVLIVLLVGLVFGKRVFSGKPMAALWGMGYSTFLLVIGSTTAMGTTGADTKVWTRVIQIMVAVTYIVVVNGVISRFKNNPKLSKV